ncbi:MAG TPA: YbaN family protein [Acidimicrobiia bacterium]
MATTRPRVRSRPVRWMWFVTGWVSVAIGSIGVVVPGLPTTVFFIIAAACFARSSPRFEQWVLDLPHIGRAVRDYRAGLGMSRRAKAFAISMMLAFGTLSIVLLRDRVIIAVAIGVLLAIGVWYIVFRVPTRERVLEQSAESR